MRVPFALALALALHGSPVVAETPTTPPAGESPEEKEARVLGLVDEEAEALATPAAPARKADPFGATPTGAVRALARIRVGELALRGIVISGNDRHALMLGPDDVVHTVRPGEKLLDGCMKRIDVDRVVLVQRSVPPGGGEAVEHEVVKKLEPTRP